MAAFIIFYSLHCASYVPVNQPSGSLLNFNIPNTEFKSLGLAEGRGCESALFGIIYLSHDFAYQAAVDNAVNALGGDVFIQTSTDGHIYAIPPVYHKRCVVVKGIVLKITPRMKEAPAVEAQVPVSAPASTPGQYAKVPFFDIARRGGKIKSIGEKPVKSKFKLVREANFPPEISHLQKNGAILFVARPVESNADVLLLASGQKKAQVEDRLSSESTIVYRYAADFNDEGRYVPVVEFIGFDGPAD